MSFIVMMLKQKVTYYILQKFLMAIFPSTTFLIEQIHKGPFYNPQVLISHTMLGPQMMVTFYLQRMKDQMPSLMLMTFLIPMM